MKLMKILYFIINLFVLTGFINVQASGIISDEIIIPPNLHTFNPPSGAGSTYFDPAFGTKIHRVTDCARFGEFVLGGYFANSEICYFNKDGSFFIAAQNDIIDGRNLIGTYLYDGQTGERVKYLGLYGSELGPYWIRWALADRYKKNGEYIQFDPKYHFYKYEGNKVVLYDFRDMENPQVIRTFSEYGAIGPAGGEGDISNNGRYWCIDGDGKELFVYDLIDDIKYPPSNFDLGSLGSKGGNVGVDYAAVSPSGKYVIVSWGTNPGLNKRYAGIELYDKNWKFIRQLHPSIIHWETGVDAFGDEVVYTVVPFDYPEPFQSAGASPGDIVSIRLSDGHVRLLKDIPKWAQIVMTACNSVTSGKYIYVSYEYRSDNPNVLWSPFWGEIIEVPTDGSQKVRRFVHTRSHKVEKSHKYYQPDAMVNRQGTRIIYRSTYNTGIGDIYMFSIEPRDEDNGGGGGSTSDDTPPNPPTNLSYSSATSSSIQLQWDAPAPASDGDVAVYYHVYRDNQKIADVYDTQYKDANIQEGLAYFYEIYSVDDAGLVSESAASGTFAAAKDNMFPQISDVSVRTRSSVRLQFSEPLEYSSAQLADNYQLNNGQVYSATLSSDNKTVVLETDALDLGLSYYVIARNIRDASEQNNMAEQLLSPRFRLLADYFDDFEMATIDRYQLRTASRWEIASDDDDSALYLNTTDYESPGGKMLGEYALVSSNDFFEQNFHIRCEARSTEDVLSNDHADYAIIFAYQDAQNYCYVQFHPYDVTFQRIENGQRVIFEEYPTTINLDSYQQIDLAYSDGQLWLAINRKLVTEWSVNINVIGQVGFGSYNDAVCFDNINIEANSIFDLISPHPPTGLRATE